MIIKLLLGLFFVLGGLYYVVRTEEVCAMFYKSASYLPKSLQHFFPLKFYQSAAFIVYMRIGGVIALLAGLAVLASIFWH
jgi:hypothetical protein